VIVAEIRLDPTCWQAGHPPSVNAKVLVVAAIALVVGLTVGFMVGQREGKTTSRRTASAAAVAEGCEAEFRMLAQSAISDMQGGWFGESPLPKSSRDELAVMGLADPVKEIIEDLKERPSLIPYPGVHGGIMAFRQSRVLSSDRVLAMFDDGHIGGWALLGFEVREKGRIDWTLIYSAVEGEKVVRPSGWR
jgi:hypothetical protein